MARTVLLSTPSSLASSCTRALPATALLIPRPCGRQPTSTSLVHLKPCHFGDFIVCSCRFSYLALLRP
ncbi:topoisomerase IA-like protein [Allocatelliglobosispora scoriae]|uniref:Topoisomerase IA-like protein n=1 Tax=Allocatelliglobosispora scoriae TaxID=643052 RepID=A0A841BZF0_9ACTN|nr:topoisomerase IA-like protein [Allocatelliglobosispora scoriae]